MKDRGDAEKIKRLYATLGRSEILKHDWYSKKAFGARYEKKNR